MRCPNLRSTLSGGMLIVAIVGVGAGMTGCDDSDDCTPGVLREFSCANGQGTQEQACVEGQWFSTTLCKDSNGDVVSGADWTDDSCKEGATRATVCGSENQGLKPQVCQSNTWTDSNSCFLGPNGDGFHFEDDPNGNGGDGGDNPGGQGNTTQNQDPATCDPLSSEDLKGGTTLGPDTCYLVNSGVKADDGVVLIKPNTTLFFDQNKGMSVQGKGRLQVEGTASKPVVFTGMVKEAGFWSGIYIDETMNGDNHIEHAVIRGAGSVKHTGWKWSAAAVYVHNGNVNVAFDHVVFENNMGTALLANDGSVDLTISNARFEQNETPMMLGGGTIGGLSESLSFKDNENTFVRVHPGESASPSKPTVWPALDIPYRVMDAVPLENDVTIAEGATFQMEQDSNLDVRESGSLTVAGSAEHPVTFEGVEDISGLWQGISISSYSGKNDLKYLNISNAGGRKWTGGDQSRAALIIRDDARAAVNHLTVRDTMGYAITLNGPSAVLEGCENFSFSGIEQAENVYVWEGATSCVP